MSAKKTKIRCSTHGIHVIEAIGAAVGTAFPTRARTMRLDYSVMWRLMLCLPREPLLIEQEDRTYLVFLVPSGRLLIYADNACRPGTGVIECDNDVEVEVEFSST